MLDRSFRSVSWLLVLAALSACEASPAPTPPGADGGTHASDRDAHVPGTSEYSCCVNDAFYDCPDDAAFDQCAGFDLDGCLDACSPSDPFCPGECFEQQAAATPDPSACVRDASRDGTCGTTSTGCTGAIGGAACDYDDDCSSSNCTDGRCYGNDDGERCEYDDDCTSSNCTEGCCYGNGVGNACEYDDDCTSSNCTDGVCRGNGAGSPCEYDDDCDSSSCTGGRCS